MADFTPEDCWLRCPELFESDQYGTFGAFGDTAVDDPDLTIEEARELDPQLVADYEEYTRKRSEIAKNCDENHTSCSGPAIIYNIKTRLPFVICPITPEPYHMPLEQT